MCSLNVSFLSNIIPKYLSLCTCEIGLLFKNIAISFRSFHFLRVINITLDFLSLNLISLSVVHSEILFNSMLAKFSASPINSSSTINIKSSAKAIIVVCFLYLRFRIGLYFMFHSPGPQHDPCGHHLVMGFSILKLFIFYDCFPFL